MSDEGTISPGYHPGLSLSIGTNEREKNWDFYLRWTYFQQTSTSFLSAQTGKHVWPFWLNNSQTSNAVVPIANSASASWNLHCNVADIEMGSSFSPSEHLSLRPFFSVRGAWIAQKFNATYNSVNFSDLFLIPSITSYNTNHFQGYGLRIGMDSFWDMGVGLSLFVTGSASLLSGYFSLSQQEIMSDGTLRSDIQNANLAIGIPEVDLLGGIVWQTRFQCDRYLLRLYTAWQQQVWFHQNQFNRFIDSVNRGGLLSEKGNLSLGGLVVGAMFGF